VGTRGFRRESSRRCLDTRLREGGVRTVPLSPSRGTIRVLHVDDEPAFTEVTREFLETVDDRLAVETATSASEGLAKLTDDVECIVSDYDMPGTDGVEFLETVREDEPDLPFILFTGKGSEAVAGEAITAGVTDYLQKERGSEQYTLLANRIHNAVSQYRAERRTERAVSAIESAQDGISLLDDDGEFFHVNDAYAEMFGYERQELRGTHWTTLYPDDHISHVHAEVLPQARNGGWQGTSEMLRKDGSQITVEHEVTYAEDGTLICTVSELDESATLRERLSLRDRAMNEAPVGIIVTDASQPDNPIVYANDRFTELTGYAREEVRGENCRFLQGPETRAEPVARMREAIDAAEPVTVELRNYRKNGELFWNQVWISPLRDDDGSVTNYVGFQQEITDRVEYERDLEEQNERLDEFASILSHDLRTPLEVATGRLALAREEYASEHLDAVANAHDRLAQLIEEVLTVAHEGTVATDVDAVDLAAAVEQSWQTVETGEATLRIESDTTVQADESRLRQLLENLVRNAIDHGGRDVTISAGALPGDDGFYVADDGGGIPAGESIHAFESGYTTSKEGIGMGLSIVQRVADAHGWGVELAESADGGARFEISGVDTGDRRVPADPVGQHHSGNEDE
jgi:PAS domain S-box-containing protein